MPRDVLIVEDESNALDVYGATLRRYLHIEPFQAQTQDAAMKLLKSYQIKVMVVDQRLELDNTRGTDLIKKAREELGFEGKSILFTGQKGVVSEAELVDAKLYRYIDKLDASVRWEYAVSEAIKEYDREMQERYRYGERTLLEERRYRLRWGLRVSIELIEVLSVDEGFFRDSEFETVAVADRNIESKVRTETTLKVRSATEINVETSELSRLGVDIGSIGAKVGAAIEDRVTLSRKVVREVSGELVVEREIRMTEISDQPDSEGVRLVQRAYQVAPVYVKLEALLRVQCNCCRIPKDLRVTVLRPTEWVATRQIEYFSDGRKSLTYLDTWKADFRPIGLPQAAGGQ